LQEALSNVAKHSGAELTVFTSIRPGEVLLRVTDYGQGFDLESESTHGGLGLISMRERLRLVGGTMKVASSPGSGAEIEVRIAIPETGRATSAST